MITQGLNTIVGSWVTQGLNPFFEEEEVQPGPTGDILIAGALRVGLNVTNKRAPNLNIYSEAKKKKGEE